VLLFWAVFILTRRLGAHIGDFLDKSKNHGGLAFNRPIASTVTTTDARPASRSHRSGPARVRADHN
jgi:hypothetical protein